MSEINIRFANLFDHSEVLKLCAKWFEELSIDGFPSVCPHSGVWLADLIANHLVFVGELGTKIIGVIGLRVGNMPWNNIEKVLFNDIFMTDIDHRNSGIATMLLAVVKRFASDQQMTLIMGHMTGTNAELKDRYLQIEGFKYGGGNFIYKGE